MASSGLFVVPSAQGVQSQPSVPRIVRRFHTTKAHLKLALLKTLAATIMILGVATMGLLEHLDELRRRIIISLISIGSVFVICFGFSRGHFCCFASDNHTGLVIRGPGPS